MLDFMGIWQAKDSFLKAGWYNQLFGALSAIFTIATGFMADTKYGSMSEPVPLHTAHGPIMLAVGALTILVTALRSSHQGLYPEIKSRRNLLLALQVIVVMLLFWGAHQGALLGDRL